MNDLLQFAAIIAGLFLLAILVMWITLPIALMKKLDKIIEQQRDANNLLADIDSKLASQKKEVKEGIRLP